MNRCGSQLPTERTTQSDSSSKEYRLRVFLPNGESSTCNCVSFAITRNRAGGKNNGGEGWCKHLEVFYKNACVWQEGPNNPAVIINGVAFCPLCGANVVGGDPVVLPESPIHAANDVKDKLLTLLAELEHR